MASVQQLEKLYQIQRIFHVESSLEAAVASERIRSIITRTEQAMRQRAFLREERRRLRVATEKLEERKRALRLIERPDWVPPQIASPDSRSIRINVGGLMFETSASVLMRDPDSLLAKLTSDNPPLMPEADGSFLFQRDWWLFRFILSFLRDGVLPDDRGLLAQLYKETAYWHLSEMQHAIEEQKLHLRKTVPKSMTQEGAEQAKKDEAKKWWRQQPSWWSAVNDADKAQKESDAKKNSKGDWWTSNTYKGQTFNTEDHKNKKLDTTTTWSDEAENSFNARSSGARYGNANRISVDNLPDPYNFVRRSHDSLR